MRVYSAVSAAVICAISLTGCISRFPETVVPSAVGEPLARAEPSDGSVTLDVLTYNIEGLQWPARTGRAPALAQIGQTLRKLRDEGRGPDVVLFQEAFSSAAVRAIAASGYPYMVRGPSRTSRSRYKTDARREGRRRPTKGEIGFRLLGSGLVIASRWPITMVERDAYSRKACAGFDCLSNKGVVFVRIAIPGVPFPIEVANTHMNAQNASKVRLERHRAAHRYQTEELAMFLERRHESAAPLILGGDFNMRGSRERFATFRSSIALEQVHEYCAQPGKCDVRMSWDGDEPWMDTQDLQFFASSQQVRIIPLRVEAMFDGSPGSPQLSDHDGMRVLYRLNWGRN